MYKAFSRAFITAFLIFTLSGQTQISAQSTTTPSPPAQALGIATGAYIVPAADPATHTQAIYGTEIGQFNSLVGKNTAVVTYYMDWGTIRGDGQIFDDTLIKAVNSQLPAGQRPIIAVTWLPQNGKSVYGCDRDYGGGVGIPPSSIVAGLCDNYIRAYADGFKAYAPQRFILRLAHEMNINNSSYWPGHFGQDAGAFVAMWRHVHDIFVQKGVTNVEWLWAPGYASYPGDAWNDIHNYYPGDDYVDWVGPDGYNWYDGPNINTPPMPWLTFGQLFDSVLKDFACRYPKPQFVHEFASVDGPGGAQTKIYWMQDAFQQMPNYPFLRAFIWLNSYAFDMPGLADFRVTSGNALDGSVHPLPSAGNPVWTNAYKSALSNSIYTSALPKLAAATPPATYCGNGETIVTVAPDLVVLEPGGQSTHTLIGMLYSSDLEITLELPAGISGSSSRDNLAAPWGTAQITLDVSASGPIGQYTVVVHAGIYSLPIQVVVARLDKHAFLPMVRR